MQKGMQWKVNTGSEKGGMGHAQEETYSSQRGSRREKLQRQQRESLTTGGPAFTLHVDCNAILTHDALVQIPYLDKLHTQCSAMFLHSLVKKSLPLAIAQICPLLIPTWVTELVSCFLSYPAVVHNPFFTLVSDAAEMQFYTLCPMPQQLSISHR